MRLFGSRVLLLPGLLAALTLTARAFAQDVATADALFTRGLADMDAGRYEAACGAMAESQRLDPRPGTLFSLAVCEVQWGRIATAVAHYGDYLSLYEHLNTAQKVRQGKRPKEAKAQRQALIPDVPELTLVLPPGAPGELVIRRDGEQVMKAALGVSLPMDPGEHLVTTQAPGGPVWEQRITLGKRDKKQLLLEVKLASAPDKRAAAPVAEKTSAAKPVQATDEPGGQRVAAYVIGGLGVAGLALGGATGFLTLREKQGIQEHCGKAIDPTDETACDQAGLEAANRARPLSLMSTIGFGAGAAGIGVAVVMLVTAPARMSTAQKQSTSWLKADVLQAGAGGAVVGVRGAW